MPEIMMTEIGSVNTRDEMLAKWKAKFPALFEGDEPKDLSLVELLEGIEKDSITDKEEDSFFEYTESPSDVVGQVSDITIQYHEPSYTLMRSNGGFSRYVDGEPVREERIDNCCPDGYWGLTKRLSMSFTAQDIRFLIDANEYEADHDYYLNCTVFTSYSMRVSDYLQELKEKSSHNGNA